MKYRVKKKLISPLVCGGINKPQKGDQFLLKTGAKATCQGGGWWSFYGYTGNDLGPVFEVVGLPGVYPKRTC